MMPLCTTETSSVMWGWAFASVGLPWVAQRVWPIPVSPSSGEDLSRASRLRSLPSERRRPSWPFSTVATPAESYPRYSSRLSASTSWPATGPLPRTPTMPHISLTPIPESHAYLPKWQKRRQFICCSPLFPRAQLAEQGRPAGPLLLRSTGERQGIGGHVLGDDATRADISALPDLDRRHQRAVRAYKGSGADLGA